MILEESWKELWNNPERILKRFCHDPLRILEESWNGRKIILNQSWINPEIILQESWRNLGRILKTILTGSPKNPSRTLSTSKQSWRSFNRILWRIIEQDHFKKSLHNPKQFQGSFQDLKKKQTILGASQPTRFNSTWRSLKGSQQDLNVATEINQLTNRRLVNSSINCQLTRCQLLLISN